jgi:hypothetical protein
MSQTVFPVIGTSYGVLNGYATCGSRLVPRFTTAARERRGFLSQVNVAPRWHVTKHGDRYAALEPISQGLMSLYGSVAAEVARGG